MMIDFDTAVSMLKESENVVILTHQNPDGDTLGCGFALAHALKQMGKNVRVKNNEPFHEKYQFLYENAPFDVFEEEFVVSVDVAEKKLLGDELGAIYGDRVDLSIDHHQNSRAFAKCTYVEPDSASACEIVYEIIKALGVNITRSIATAIYTGCSTDTGCFRYPNVTERTHLIAAELIKYGARHSEVNTRMFESKKYSDLLLQKLCLDELEVCLGGEVAVILITQQMLKDTGADKTAIDCIKPITRQIEGVEIGVTIREEADGKISVSVRTGEKYDASVICRHFGGGGHIRAAGCEVENSDIVTVRKEVLDFIEREIVMVR